MYGGNKGAISHKGLVKGGGSDEESKERKGYLCPRVPGKGDKKGNEHADRGKPLSV